jgi:hypothetical protein
MSNRLYFMIEGGKALALIQHHIAERLRVRTEAIAIAKELGAEDVSTSIANGAVVAAKFKGAVHPDFKKPGKYGSFPKQGSEWAKRFADQKGYEEESHLIASTFDIPLSIGTKDENGSGWRCIGHPLQECGFLYLGKDGPYAMWIPDVEAEVAADTAKGLTVQEPERSFRAVFDGCRRIDIEEWEILVAQHNLAKKRAAREKEPA